MEDKMDSQEDLSLDFSVRHALDNGRITLELTKFSDMVQIIAKIEPIDGRFYSTKYLLSSHIIPIELLEEESMPLIANAIKVCLDSLSAACRMVEAEVVPDDEEELGCL